jgi:type IV pilus assembly protein PilY1
VNKHRRLNPVLFLAINAIYPLPVLAQLVVSDTLTGPTSGFSWSASGGACLTAGTNATRTPLASGNSSLPACIGLPYYGNSMQVGGVSGRLPDPVGKGALRLTNGDYRAGDNGNGQAGAVISTEPFPTNQGVQVTFSTATYGGNGYQGTGADGMVFMLLDAARGVPAALGAVGGSLGYSCSNGNYPYDGISGGYVGVGIDEFGNFSNPGDTTADGPGFRSNAVGIRGAGSVNWASLNAAYPAYYPNSLQDRAAAVKKTCQTGYLHDFSGNNGEANGVPRYPRTTIKVADYAMIGTPVNLANTIYNQEAIANPLRYPAGNLPGANIITYALQITQDNLLSLSYSYAGGVNIPVISNRSITDTNGPLPANFLFGFSAATGGGSNVHEILCFKAAPINLSATSAGSNVQQSARVEAGSQVYLAYYHPLNSWGQLTASNLVTDTAGTVSIAPVANWDASCTLTGGTCTPTGTSVTAQAPSARTILSWNGATGIPFQYANLAASDADALGGTVDGSARISYLRGDRSNERTTTGSGAFRRRDGVLGDIVNSSPTWVGAPTLSYATAGKDLLSRTTVAEFGAAYTSFTSSKANQASIVYAGANDGMLHGFRAGSMNASGTSTTTSTPNDGKELLAYMPQIVAQTIHPSTSTTDFSSPGYAHNSYVDATPGTGDLYYNGAWHTWLVSGLGAGGNPSGAINDITTTAAGALFALDITTPANFSEANAAALVLGEWNSTNLTCVNLSTCNTHLGSLYGTPIIRRLHDGNWAVIFGNGRNSAAGTAGIFIMTVNRADGARTFRYLDTGSGSASAKNGIDFVQSGDLDGDHVTDYVYAGDTAGNLWRFDLTSAAPGSWNAGTRTIFSTPAGQPISTRVTVSSVVDSSQVSPRVLIAFGTGRQTPQTLNSASAYADGTQYLYGIWDSHLESWNALGSAQYTSLASAHVAGANELQAQTITETAAAASGISGYRSVSQAKVCWKGSSACPSSNNQYGWKLALPVGTEQVIYNPIVAYGTFIVNTSIPAVTQTLSCTKQPASGYTMAISMGNGGAPTNSPFLPPGNSSADTSAGVVAGLGLSATGSPSIVTAKGNPFIVQQTVTGTGSVNRFYPPGNLIGKRESWVKLR